jgi:putative salt-induced outer membrane protein
MNIRSVCVFAALVLSAPVLADEEEAKGPWAGKAVLGYLATSGNTNSSNLNSGFEISYTKNQWVHGLTTAAIFASTEDVATGEEVTTAEAYEAAWKSQRNFGEHNYMFGQLDWRKDRFSGYDQQFAQVVGYGRRLVDKEKHKLNAEIGAGARQSDLADGTQEDETVVRGALDYKWQLSETSAFQQRLTIESGNENTYTESVTRLSASLIGNLALVASYTLKNNSEVPVGIEETDKFTALSLEYTF